MGRNFYYEDIFEKLWYEDYSQRVYRRLRRHIKRWRGLFFLWLYFDEIDNIALYLTKHLKHLCMMIAENFFREIIKEEYLTVRDVARLFRVTPETVRKWIKEGKIKAIRPEKHKRYRISWAEVEQFLESGGGEL